MSDYKKSGVDTEAADKWVQKIAAQVGVSGPVDLRERMRSGVGDYAAVYALNKDQWVGLSCDGVGTKMLWAEQGLGSMEGIAQDLVAMNANDLLCVGAKPTLFLDYLAVGSTRLLENGAPLEGFMKGLSKAAAASGMIVVGGETAQMPDVYGERGFDMAGFAIGFLEPREHLNAKKILPGSELWGWTSSGPHSNGFSWLRRLFDGKRDAELIRKHFMTPTRLYASDFLAFRTALRNAHLDGGLQSAFHITGSGLLNLIRAQPEGRQIGFDVSEWPVPKAPWLLEIAARAEGGMDALWSTFNMGYGFCFVLSRELVQKGSALLHSAGLTRLGHVIAEPVVKVRGVELR